MPTRRNHDASALSCARAGSFSPIKDQYVSRKSVFAILCAMIVAAGPALADGSGDPTAMKDEDGKYFDKEGNPTYKISGDRTVDWYTYSGFRRYHSDCHVCHGPDGEGSSYAPAL